MPKSEKPRLSNRVEATTSAVTGNPFNNQKNNKILRMKYLTEGITQLFNHYKNHHTGSMRLFTISMIWVIDWLWVNVESLVFQFWIAKIVKHNHTHRSVFRFPHKPRHLKNHGQYCCFFVCTPREYTDNFIWKCYMNLIDFYFVDLWRTIYIIYN